MANLQDADLRDAKMNGSSCKSINATGAAINGPNAECKNCDFDGSIMSGANLRDCHFDNSRFANAQMNEIDGALGVFIRCNFADSDLRGAKLREASMMDVQAPGASFEEAVMQGLNADRSTMPGLRKQPKTHTKPRSQEVFFIFFGSCNILINQNVNFRHHIFVSQLIIRCFLLRRERAFCFLLTCRFVQQQRTQGRIPRRLLLVH